MSAFTSGVSRGANIATEVTGIRDVVNALRILQPETQERLRAVVRESATAAVAGAKSRVPVLSGELAGTIRADYTKDGLVAFVKAGFGTLKRRSRAKVGSKRRGRARAKQLGPIEPGIYAMVVEFGSTTQPAQPYLFPAIEAVRPGHLARAEKALHDAVAAADRAGS